MNSTMVVSGIAVESVVLKNESANYDLPTWPPSDDFPVVKDASGKVVSRFGDSIWDFTPWCRKVTRLNFGDGVLRRDDPGITPDNSRILRLIMFWYLYRPGKRRSARTYVNIFTDLRGLFVFCSIHKVYAVDLVRFPRLLELLPSSLGSFSANQIISTSHDIWDHREELGFYLMDPSSLREYANSVVQPETFQTEYIPPRIWLYQLGRLKHCLEDFLKNAKQIEDCFNFCLDAYAHNAGSLTEACTTELPETRKPFNSKNQRLTGSNTGAVFPGAFTEIAKRFKVYDLLQRWLTKVDSGGMTTLSTYFTFISLVGTAYLMNYSLMRKDEAFSLRSKCLVEELDELTTENVYILQGATTKTIQDDSARWITSPSAVLAVDALSLIARLRMVTAAANPKIPLTTEDKDNPYLYLRPYEPWRRQVKHLHQPLMIRPTTPSYYALTKAYPKLFDAHELTITKADLEIALMVTPTLDPKIYDVGKPWIFAWHQLRRTGAVNMGASGLVSDASIQYQLKHATRAMSRYYKQGHRYLHFGLNENSRLEFINAMYETIAIEFKQLQSHRFVSPHGERRKSEILRIISDKDHKELIAAAKSGKIHYKATLLGGCTNPDPCPFGGVEHVARCGGGDGKAPCNDALFDRTKMPQLQKLLKVVNINLNSAPSESPLRDSLQAQLRGVENAINALETN
ncbi:hypothetical protein HXW87_02715 [Pseudomonas sp. Y5-11]|uniref:hypothetical protein n=1 Tax=Pseudomonas TaxID=286 RepID=UPI000ADDF92D|nr:MULTISPECIES: hypothetical protein [Pseudomonas]ULN81109.1 hypothetical protein HXW87_02715 [Pseudomonas sp. Y5-11]